LNTLLGDLMDDKFVGETHPWFFEKRLKFYQMADNNKRVASLYEILYFHMPVCEAERREEILEKIIELYRSTNNQFDLGIIFFLLNYYISAGDRRIEEFLEPTVIRNLQSMTFPENVILDNGGNDSPNQKKKD
jgi:hypothetical protein